MTAREPIRSITVSVNFHDYLAISAPYNNHHFQGELVVTSPEDIRTQGLAEHLKSIGYNIDVFVTDAFYRDKAAFNKFRALEEGLDHMGRYGWIAIRDADILWPSNIPAWALEKGRLYTPFRRMFNGNRDGSTSIPQEDEWKDYPRHQQQVEWAGYTQVFHAEDTALGKAPWHEIDLMSAGTADSFFQRKWETWNKLRPPFEVLHMGESGKNWLGRVTPYLDGSIPPNAAEKSHMLEEMLAARKGKIGMDRFAHERIKI